MVVDFSKTLSNLMALRGWTRENTAHELGVSSRKLGRWLAGDQLPEKAGDILALKRVFKFSEMELERLLRLYVGSSSKPRPKTFAKLLQEGWTLESLAEKLHYIEEVEFPFLPSSKAPKDTDEYGDPDSWLGTYDNCRDTGCVLFDDSGEIASHWLFCPVKPNIFKDGVSGKNINSTFSTMSLRPFGAPGDYDVYFVSLFLRRIWNNPVGNREVLFSIQDKMLHLADEGFFIRRIFGNMSSPLMITLADNIGFHFECDHDVHEMLVSPKEHKPTEVWSLDLKSPDSDSMLSHTPRLLERYTEWRKNTL